MARLVVHAGSFSTVQKLKIKLKQNKISKYYIAKFSIKCISFWKSSRCNFNRNSRQNVMRSEFHNNNQSLLKTILVIRFINLEINSTKGDGIYPMRICEMFNY